MALSMCSGFGLCHVGLLDSGLYGAMCTCFEGFGGPDCSLVEETEHCPGYCNGHGTCDLTDTPHCECDSGWDGPGCADSRCPSTADGVCSKHGVCADSSGSFECSCDPTWRHGPSNACEESLCPNACSSKGQCNINGSCTCRVGFTGDDCSQVVVSPSPSPSPKSANTAITPTGTEKGDASEEVSSMPCPNDCNDHGVCNDGKCECTDGFDGTDCSIAPATTDDDDGLDALGFLVQTDEGSHAPKKGSMAKLWD